MAKMSENSIKLLNYMKGITDDVTVHDIANDLGTSVASVTGMFNAFVKKGLGVREEVEVKDGDSIKIVKFLKLTDAGQAYDPSAEEDA